MTSVLEQYDLVSGAIRTVFRTDRLIEAPNVSPCGTWVLVNGDGALFRVPLDRPDLVPIDIGVISGCNNDHGFSPDGQMIYLSAHHRGLGSEIYTVPATGGTPRLISLHPKSWWHGVSPDGGSIVFPAVRGDAQVIDIYIQGPDGIERQLTHGEGHADGPDFSVDGKTIYFNWEASGHAQIWAMKTDGSDKRMLFADDHVNWFPHPSPDGRTLAYLAYPPGTEGHPRDCLVKLMLCDLDGGNRREIARFNGGQGTMNVPNWAPDGLSIYFMTYPKETAL